MDWLVNTFYYIVPFLVLLGILVFVHEFGHYIAAKMSGVKVDEFSIGFGKELWGFKDKSGTHWKISAVPLGGYCKFLGDADASSSTTDGAVHELSEEDRKYAFPFQSPFKKLFIVIAGPAANYLFAIAVFTGIFFFLGKISYPPVVGAVMEDSAAAKAGIQVNDRIVKINGVDIANFDDIRRETALAPDGKVYVEIDRNGQMLNLDFTLKVLEFEDHKGKTEKRALIGIKSASTIKTDNNGLPLFSAVKEAGLEAWDMSYTTLRAVGQMLTGQRGGEDIGGILRIAELSGDISKGEGVLDFLVFMAVLSVNLGLINLFPVPVLDGGHVVFYVIEIIIGREINDKIKENLFKVGLALILALMVFATWNDAVHLFDRWFS